MIPLEDKLRAAIHATAEEIPADPPPLRLGSPGLSPRRRPWFQPSLGAGRIRLGRIRPGWGGRNTWLAPLAAAAVVVAVVLGSLAVTGGGARRATPAASAAPAVRLLRRDHRGRRRPHVRAVRAVRAGQPAYPFLRLAHRSGPQRPRRLRFGASRPGIAAAAASLIRPCWRGNSGHGPVAGRHLAGRRNRRLARRTAVRVQPGDRDPADV